MTADDATDAVVDVEAPGFRPPRQERSRDTLRRLTEAVEELLLETGSTDLSVRDLVDRADTSVGAFYARFDHRDAALAYTSHAFWARSRQLWARYLVPERWIRATAACMAAAVIRTFARVMLADAERLRAFVRLSLATPGGELIGRIGEHDRFIAAAVAGVLVERGGEIRHPRPRRAAEEGFRRVLGAVRDHVVYHVDADSRSGDDDAAFILSLVQMYGRHLDLHPVPASYGELLTLAVRGP